MNEIDEKVQGVYSRIDKVEERLIQLVDKAKANIKEDIDSKIEAAEDLINTTSTVRTKSVEKDLNKLEQHSRDCAISCADYRSKIDTRLQSLEDWKNANWQRTIVWATVAIVAAVKIIDWMWPAIQSLVK